MYDISVQYDVLSHDVASGSEITPCNKIEKPVVVNYDGTNGSLFHFSDNSQF